jgi:hypothetical protein
VCFNPAPVKPYLALENSRAEAGDLAITLSGRAGASSPASALAFTRSGFPQRINTENTR